MMMKVGTTTSCSNLSTAQPDWAVSLDLGILQSISSCLDHPYVPGALRLSSMCCAWRTAADQTAGLSITWPVWSAVEDGCLKSAAALYQEQFLRWQGVHRSQQQQQEIPNQQLQQGPDVGSFTIWLGKNAGRLHSFTLEVPDVHRSSDIHAVWAALTSAATAAAAAGSPLPLQELRVPLQQLQLPYDQLGRANAANPPAPPANLLAILPGLRRLCVPLEVMEPPPPIWVPAWADPPPRDPVLEELHRRRKAKAQAVAADAAAFFEVLPGLKQLQSLEVILRPWSRVLPGLPLSYWQQLLEAAPKQLQQLSFSVFDIRELEQYPLRLAYNWAPLAAFTQLRQLRVDGIAAGVDLAPLAQLPALDSFSTRQVGPAVLEPLLVVKGLLRELDVGWVPPGQQEHLEQLTHITSLSLTADKRPGSCLPVKVAAGLQRLDWTAEFYYSSSSSSSGSSGSGGLLAGCSSSNLRDLQLRGQGWNTNQAAAEAVQQLTGLTAFGLHSLSGERNREAGPWFGWDALMPLRQLRSLALPQRRLNAPPCSDGIPHLGRFPHLTRLVVAASSAGVQGTGNANRSTWPVEEVLSLCPADKQRLLANLRSCSASLKVLEVDLLLHPLDSPVDQLTAPYAGAAVRAALQQALPGVYVLVRGHVESQACQKWYRPPPQVPGRCPLGWALK